MHFISFDGSFISKGMERETYAFIIGDIYLTQRDKWLKADSTDGSKLFTNMKILRTAKNFSFYTTGKYKSRYLRSHEEAILFQDIVAKDKKTGNRTFTLNVIALLSNYGLIVKCQDCELVQSLNTPTPVGTIQCNQIKYGDMSIEQIGTLPAQGKR